MATSRSVEARDRLASWELGEPRSLLTPFRQEIYQDFAQRREGLVLAVTEEVELFWRECDPNKENLCLYGNPDGSWKVGLPVEEVPPELPEPALGVNFARDGMAVRGAGGRANARGLQLCLLGLAGPPHARPGRRCATRGSHALPRSSAAVLLGRRRRRRGAVAARRSGLTPGEQDKEAEKQGKPIRVVYYKWLELVAVHSDAWLMSVAFFYAAKADKVDRQASSNGGRLPACRRRSRWRAQGQAVQHD